jgi:hypothetical protein
MRRHPTGEGPRSDGEESRAHKRAYPVKVEAQYEERKMVEM